MVPKVQKRIDRGLIPNTMISLFVKLSRANSLARLLTRQAQNAPDLIWLENPSHIPRSEEETNSLSIILYADRDYWFPHEQRIGIAEDSKTTNPTWCFSSLTSILTLLRFQKCLIRKERTCTTKPKSWLTFAFWALPCVLRRRERRRSICAILRTTSPVPRYSSLSNLRG